MVCLDTDLFIALLKGDKDAVNMITQLEAEGKPLKTTAITAYELLKGALLSSRPEENLASVSDLLSVLQVLTLTNDSCLQAAKTYDDLRRKGYLIGEFDILIAAIATSNDEALISRDLHFRIIEGLNLQAW
jgi:predicted nucleic acid-binding protein